MTHICWAFLVNTKKIKQLENLQRGFQFIVHGVFRLRIYQRKKKDKSG